MAEERWQTSWIIDEWFACCHNLYPVVFPVSKRDLQRSSSRTCCWIIIPSHNQMIRPDEAGKRDKPTEEEGTEQEGRGQKEHGGSRGDHREAWGWVLSSEPEKWGLLHIPDQPRPVLATSPVWLSSTWNVGSVNKICHWCKKIHAGFWRFSVEKKKK